MAEAQGTDWGRRKARVANWGAAAAAQSTGPGEDKPAPIMRASARAKPDRAIPAEWAPIETEDDLAAVLLDPYRRLNSLYKIIDVNGSAVRFRMNPVQAEYYHNRHDLDVILKSRQHGITTLCQLIMLDCCLFHENTHAACIAHRREDAEEIFTSILKFAYDNLPAAIRDLRPANTDSARKLAFSNGSSVRSGTTLRGGTYQLLHISEFGKLCAKAPEKAREVVTGALNTVHPGQSITIESTAEGREGAFFDLCQRAQHHQGPLGPMDWKFHFFGWTQDDKCRTTGPAVITSDMKAYFEELYQAGIDLSPEQRAWYVKKKLTQGDDMKREYPSTPEEAFESAIDGAYFGREMARARDEGRIGDVPWKSGSPVNTFWDLGRNDQMAIWFHQRIGQKNCLIDYYSNSNEALGHYAKVLKDKPYVYGKHYLPHDIETAELIKDQTRKLALLELGIKPIKTVRRAESVSDDIQAVRIFLGSCWFDESKCDADEKELSGIKALENYRREWDERLGAFKDKPLHNWASDGADAFRTGAIGFEEEPDGLPHHVQAAVARRRAQWRKGIH